MKRTVKVTGFITAIIMLLSIFSINCLAMDNLDWELSFGTFFQNAIAANDSICVSVGSCGTIFKSDDGINWTKNKTVTNYDINDIVWNGKEFIAVGDHGLIMSSSNGKHWEMKDSGTSMNLEEIIWSGKTLVTYGSDSTTKRSVILSSNDSVGWNATELEESIIYSMAFNDGKFLALNHFTRGVISSINGAYWIKLDVPIDFESGAYRITSFSGHFIIVDCAFSGPRRVYMSKDAVLWEPKGTFDEVTQIMSRSHQLSIISSAKDFLLISGDYGVAYTDNINDWEYKIEISNISGEEDLIQELIFFKGQYIGIVLDGFVISKDFKSWEKVTTQPSFILNSIASDGTSYLAVGERGAAYISFDGLNWTECSTQTENNFISASWDGKQFILLDNNGTIYATKDGAKWDVICSLLDLFPNEYWSCNTLTYTKNRYFLFFNSPNAIYSSEDLKKWNKVNIGDAGNEYIMDIVSNDKIYVAVGARGNVYTSTDAVNWAVRYTSPTNCHLNRIIWNGKQFVAIGNNNTAINSNDGITWTEVSTNPLYSLNGINSEGKDICWNGKEYLVFDDTMNNTICSKDGFDWVFVANQRNFESNGIVWTGYRYISIGRYAIRTAVPKNIIKVIIDGKPIKFDVAPQMLNNRNLLPARYMFEAFGAKVQWNEKTKTITISGNGKELILKINDNRAYVNGKVVQLDAAPIIVDGRTLIPLRFVAESFGAELDWDQDTQTVIIKTY